MTKIRIRKTKKKHYDVIGFGALNVDRLGIVDNVVTDGETMVGNEKIGAGGSAANTISALSNLGLKTAYIGAIGDDKEGKILLDDFNKWNVDTTFLKRKQEGSGVVLGLTDNKGNRALYIYPGVNNSLISKDMPNQFSTKYIHLSSFVSPKQLELQIRFISNLDPKIKVSIAPGMIYTRLGISRLKHLLNNCHYIFLTKEELEILFRKKGLDVANELINHKTKLVVVTAGKSGCYLITQDLKDFFSAFQAEMVDSTGAGDTFIAGFLHGLASNLDYQSCAIAGNLLASYSIQKIGARNGYPTEYEFKKKLDIVLQNYNQEKVQYADRYINLDNTGSLWSFIKMELIYENKFRKEYF